MKETIILKKSIKKKKIEKNNERATQNYFCFVLLCKKLLSQFFVVFL